MKGNFVQKKSLIVFAPIPPPFHGASYVVNLLLNSSFVNEFNVRHINAFFTRSLENLAKPSLGKLFLLSKYVMTLIWTAMLNKYDCIIIVPGYNLFSFMKDSIIIYLSRWFFRIKVIIWSHGNDVSFFYESLRPLCRRAFKFTILRASCIVVVAESLRQGFSPLVPQDKIKVINNGLPTFPLSEPKQSNHGVKVIFLSNMLETKGWKLLLTVADELCNVHPNVHFGFYGSPSIDSPRSVIESEFQKRNYPDRIKYYGPIYGAKKQKVFAEADIFCLPTYYRTEALPISILEAMQAGLAIVTTAIGGIGDAVIDGMGGIIIEQRNSRSLHEALRELIIKPELCLEMGQFNRERFAKLYTLDKMVSSWVELVNTLV